MAISKMMDKGMVVIPKEIRDALKLKKGDRVGFLKLGRQIFMMPLSGDPIEALYGSLPSKGSMADFLEEKRRELAEEEKDLPPPRSLRSSSSLGRRAAKVK